MIVVSDTSPLNYLILIDQIDILPKLFGEVVIPQVVLNELGGEGAPEKVIEWLESPPDWLVVRPNLSADPFGLSHIDAGEREAILLAAEISADLVLLDDRKARIAAKKIGLRIAGTIGVIDKAAREGLIDAEDIVRRLGSTNFYVSAELIRELLKDRPN